MKVASPGLELNDLGFEGRADYKSLSTIVGVQSFTAGAHLQSFSASTGQNAALNFGSVLISNSAFLKGNATLNNFWTVGASASTDRSVRSDRLTRGGPQARTATAYSTLVSLGSDTRRLMSSSASGSYGWDDYGSHMASASAGIVVRPSASVRVSVTPSLSGGLTALQYLQSASDAMAAATFGRRYVFASLHQTTLSGDTRIEWTFTPQLTLQLYAQPFVSAGRYAAFKQLAAPSSSSYPQYGTDLGTITRNETTHNYTIDPDGAGPTAPFTVVNPDFNVRSLRGNAVLRWEYRPGSQLYVVGQQERSGAEAFGDFDLSRDTGAIFRQQMTNVFAVKFTYSIGT
ncbi:MAG: DUF5916 domain-containing protein [bacterium]